MRAATGGLLLSWLLLSGAADALPLNAEEEAGKRIYLQGLSSSGAEIHARVGAGGMALPASAVPCASCHGADGQGRPEGGVRPPPITWQRLSVAYGQQRNGRRYPAYDEVSLARAVEEGVDSAGNRLDPAMPRFVLSPKDMQALTAYLKRLEQDRDPGVAVDQLSLGTLLPDSAAGRALESLLRAELQRINDAGGIHGRRLELLTADPGVNAASAATALEQLLAEGQVFALLATLLPSVDERFNELLRDRKVVLIGPLSATAAGVAEAQVFEVLPGAEQQLQALMQFASTRLPRRAALVLYTAGFQSQAEGLARQLATRGWQQVSHQPLAEAQGWTEPPDTDVLFYIGNEPGLAALGQQLAQQEPTPWLLGLSSQLAGAALQLPEAFSGRVLLAYPFTPGDWSADGLAALQRAQRQPEVGRYLPLQVGLLAAVEVLEEALRRAGRDVSRSRLVSSIESLHDFQTGLTPSLSYGPGQRVGAAGAHIVQVDIVGQRFRPVGDYTRVQRDR